MTFAMTPIGVVRNDRTEPVDDDWDRINSSIELDLSLLGEEATKGLFRFSHIEVVFVFDRVDPGNVELAVFCRNLTDEVYKTYAFDATNFSQVVLNFVGTPRTIGMDVIISF